MTREAASASPRPESRTWWLHPFLVAAFPVLFLFAANAGEHLSVAPLLAPLGIVLALAAIGVVMAWLVGSLTGAGPTRAALGVSVLLVLGLTYGHAWNGLGETLRSHAYLLAAWAMLAIIGLALVARIDRQTAARVSGGLTVVALVLVAANVLPLWQLAGRGPIAGVTAPEPSASDPVAAGTRDVWYVVLDRYAGSVALERTYDFDNSAFLDALRERGFVVAERATANYLKTGMSLVSSLNMAELDVAALAQESTAADDWTPIIRRIQSGHAVERFLHQRGYRYLHVGSRLGDTIVNAAADEAFVYTDTSEFSAALIDTTILAALEGILPSAVPRGSIAYVPDQSLAQFEHLREAADRPGLDFVFAHILLPHPPYVFNADGSRVTDAQRDTRTVDEQYVEQVRFTNATVLDLVDRLQSGPPDERPIVVIAADEGPFPERYRRDEEGFRWLEARPDELLRKFSILTAINVPGADEAGLEAAGFSDTLTAANLFRVVFNAAFDAGLPMVDAGNWVFVDQRHLYDMVEVTDRVRAAHEPDAAALR